MLNQEFQTTESEIQPYNLYTCGLHQSATKYHEATYSLSSLPSGMGRDGKNSKTHGLRQKQFNNWNTVPNKPQ